jgi:hypothetical protein
MRTRISQRGGALVGLLLSLAATAAHAQMTNHGGPVIVSAKVVFIFWGPSFGVGGADNNYATKLEAYRDQLGMTPEYNVLTQYCGTNGCVQLTNLGSGTADWFDTSTPPVNVTDAKVQAKVNAYLATHAFNASTIYEVVLPSTSYSSDGSSTSCGGPNLAYCSYHSWIGSGVNATKYTVQPYASCSGCTVTGWTPAQNQEHFIEHGVAETVTSPAGNGWYDASGNDVADKCAWSPPPFLVGGFGYQYLWSNLTHSCVKTL